jgi:tetratricopeptide (TPR) repeat protein
MGKGGLEKAACLLENVADHAPTAYRIRALISLGANQVLRGDYRTALSFYLEALRFVRRSRVTDYTAVVRAQKDIAVIKSLEGDRVGALAILSSTKPIAQSLRTTHPHLYFDYLNNLAVDLNEVGRFEEAAYACDLALASPFASSYPEWHETREEIETRKRSSASRSSVSTKPQASTRGQFSDRNNIAIRSAQSLRPEVTTDQPAISWPEAPAEGGTDNLVRMPLPELNTRPFVSPFAESDARGRVLEFSSRTRALEEENGEDESDVSESRKTVADKLYEMLMAAIDGVEFDQGLVETLYRDYLLKRTCNG